VPRGMQSQPTGGADRSDTSLAWIWPRAGAATAWTAHHELLRFLPSKPEREPLPSNAISDHTENDIER
jgi:hypothetical protein